MLSFARTLKEELQEAKRDTRLAARWKTYRMNLPSQDSAKMLLNVEDWQTTLKRTVTSRYGKPIVGIDLSSSRAWSTATARWESGRVEVLALTGGEPSIEKQERSDQVNPGAYQRMVDAGTLAVDEGLRVPRPSLLWAMVQEAWGMPALVVCDRFRHPELLDVIGHPFPLSPG